MTTSLTTMSDYNIRAIQTGDLSAPMLREIVALAQEQLHLPATGMATGELRAEALVRAAKRIDTLPNPYDTPFGQVIAWVARECVGLGEEVRNNQGSFLDMMREACGLPGKGPWCALFASYVYLRAYQMTNTPVPFELSTGARRLGRAIAAEGHEIARPEPGCVIVWNRGKPWAWTKHIEICSAYDAETDTAVTFPANIGKFPSRVQETTWTNGSWRRRKGLGRVYLIATPTPF